MKWRVSDKERSEAQAGNNDKQQASKWPMSKQMSKQMNFEIEDTHQLGNMCSREEKSWEIIGVKCVIG